MAELNSARGSIRGLSNKGVTAFLGIPFARPPVGERRWLPPEAADSWSGTLDATRHPNRCWQMQYPETLGQPEIPGGLSEDCLYLNIHRPVETREPLPVVVYIHGGGYVGGSANDFNPSPFVARHNVVFVAMNYRLGMFGFLDLERFGAEYRSSCSLGYQDQILALKWIKENIADYGGDPGNITLSGVSAGAGSVLSLMGAPSAKGLYHRGAAFSPASGARDTAPDIVALFSDMMNLSQAEFFEHIKNLSGEELFQLQNGMGYQGLPQVDGNVIVSPPDEAIAQGINPVPLLTGCCRDEGTMLAATVAEFKELDPEEMVVSNKHALSKGNVDGYENFLEQLLPEADKLERTTRIWYDYFRAPLLQAAQALGDAGIDSWVYRFEVPTDHPFGPTHASDMAFSFNLFAGEEIEEGQYLPFHPNTEENRARAALWTDSFGHFARYGTPATGGMPDWPNYERDKRPCMVVGESFQLVENLDSEGALEAYGLK